MTMFLSNNALCISTNLTAEGSLRFLSQFPQHMQDMVLFQPLNAKAPTACL